MAATWVFAKDTNGSLDVGTKYRMRFALKETTNFFFEEGTIYNVLYNKNSSGNFLQVTGSSSNIQIRTSTHYAHGDDCTQQISSPDPYKTFTDLMSEQNTVALGARFRGRTTETEWCFELIGADLNDGDTIELRIYRATGVIEGYTKVPVITAYKPPPLWTEKGISAVSSTEKVIVPV